MENAQHQSTPTSEFSFDSAPEHLSNLDTTATEQVAEYELDYAEPQHTGSTTSQDSPTKEIGPTRAQMEKLRDLDIRGLAFDLVIYGSKDIDGVLRSYDLSQKDYDLLLKNNIALNREISQIRTELEASPENGVRMRARNTIEAGLMFMHEIISNPLQDPKARVQAFAEVAKVADVLPKANQERRGGQTVEINFGSLLPTISITQNDDGIIDA